MHCSTFATHRDGPPLDGQSGKLALVHQAAKNEAEKQKSLVVTRLCQNV